jgi:hypothetical protein
MLIWIFQSWALVCQIPCARALALVQDHRGRGRLERVDWVANDPPIACDEKS